MNNEDIQLRCVLVGDGCAGKACMARTFATKKFTPDYIPTVSARLAVNDKLISMNLHLKAGQEDYDRLRPLG
jgi:GTPase SAR1 family protein